eukprot:5457007-Alexandrium_andersonii.AAC.1
MGTSRPTPQRLIGACSEPPPRGRCPPLFETDAHELGLKIMGRSNHTLVGPSGQRWLVGPDPSPRRPQSTHTQTAIFAARNRRNSGPPPSKSKRHRRRAKRGASGARH